MESKNSSSKDSPAQQGIQKFSFHFTLVFPLLFLLNDIFHSILILALRSLPTIWGLGKLFGSSLTDPVLPGLFGKQRCSYFIANIFRYLKMSFILFQIGSVVAVFSQELWYTRIPLLWNFSGSRLVGNLRVRWDHTEPYVPFRWVFT